MQLCFQLFDLQLFEEEVCHFFFAKRLLIHGGHDLKNNTN
jgi:hypothetical protein